MHGHLQCMAICSLQWHVEAMKRESGAVGMADAISWPIGWPPRITPSIELHLLRDS